MARLMRVDVRPAIAVYGLFIVFGLVIAAFFPFLAIYLAGRGLTPDQIGLVIAAMAAARLLFLPVWGHVADTTIGRLTTLQVGAVGTAIAGLAMNVVHGLGAIAVVGFVLSAFMVSTGPNIDAIALVYLGQERMSDYGRIRGWESLSYAGGCLVFGSIFQAAGIRWAMPMYGAASIAVLVWSATLKRDYPKDVSHPGRLGSVGAVFREAPRFWGFLASILLLWTGFNAAWNFIALKIERGGGGPLLVGIGTALGGAIELPTMRLSSRLQVKWGLRRVYATGSCIYALGFLLWGLVSNPTLLSLLTVFEGLAFGLLFTTGVVVIGRLLPSSLYSTGNSIAAMVGFGIGPIIGAGIGGFVYQHAGPPALYVGASALALCGAAVAWLALSTPELSEPSPIQAVTAGVEPERGIVP